MCANPDLVKPTYDPSSIEVETGSEAQGYSLQGNEFEVSYRRPCLKTGER